MPCFPSFPPRYAIRESNSVVKIFKNFKEKKSFKPDFGAESECYLFMTILETCNGSETSKPKSFFLFRYLRRLLIGSQICKWLSFL